MDLNHSKVNLYQNIPTELTERSQWIVWKHENNTKVPYQAVGRAQRKASSTDPRTWASFDKAVGVVRRKLADGIGFVFTNEDPYVGIDLDNKTDDSSKDIQNRAWVARFSSYTELSPSGKGYHIIVTGELDGGINKGGARHKNHFL